MFLECVCSQELYSISTDAKLNHILPSSYKQIWDPPSLDPTLEPFKLMLYDAESEFDGNIVW